jgi:uncharacterized membrane protein YbhN (UPF0104 family)
VLLSLISFSIGVCFWLLLSGTEWGGGSVIEEISWHTVTKSEMAAQSSPILVGVEPAPLSANG